MLAARARAVWSAAAGVEAAQEGVWLVMAAVAVESATVTAEARADMVMEAVGWAEQWLEEARAGVHPVATMAVELAAMVTVGTAQVPAPAAKTAEAARAAARAAARVAASVAAAVMEAATVIVVARAAAVKAEAVGAVAVMAESATVEAKAGVVRAVGRAVARVAAMVPRLSPCHRAHLVVAARTGATRAVQAEVAARARAVWSAAAGVEAEVVRVVGRAAMAMAVVTQVVAIGQSLV